jgi:hypothetical protein
VSASENQQYVVFGAGQVDCTLRAHFSAEVTMFTNQQTPAGEE